MLHGGTTTNADIALLFLHSQLLNSHIKRRMYLHFLALKKKLVINMAADRPDASVQPGGRADHRRAEPTADLPQALLHRVLPTRSRDHPQIHKKGRVKDQR